MSEPQAEYQTARTIETLRAEIDKSTEIILRAVSHWDRAVRLDKNSWRIVIQQVFERLDEALDEETRDE